MTTIHVLRHDNEKQVTEQVVRSTYQISEAIAQTANKANGLIGAAGQLTNATTQAVGTFSRDSEKVMEKVGNSIDSIDNAATKIGRCAQWLSIGYGIIHAVTSIGTTILKYRVASQAVDNHDKRIDQAIQMADRQCTSTRNDLKKISLEGIGVIRDEMDAGIGVVRTGVETLQEGVRGGLAITDRTASIACSILAFMGTGYLLQKIDPASPVHMIGTIASLTGLIGVGIYCARGWNKGSKEMRNPMSQESLDALGIIKAKAALHEFVWTEEELKILERKNPAAVGTAKFKQALHEFIWTKEELQLVNK